MYDLHVTQSKMLFHISSTVRFILENSIFSVVNSLNPVYSPSCSLYSVRGTYPWHSVISFSLSHLKISFTLLFTTSVFWKLRDNYLYNSAKSNPCDASTPDTESTRQNHHLISLSRDEVSRRGHGTGIYLWGPLPLLWVYYLVKRLASSWIN